MGGKRIWLTMLHNVKHDGQQFFKDEKRFVDINDAADFCEHGWAKTADGSKPVKEVDLTPKTLDIDNGSTVTKASEVGNV